MRLVTFVAAGREAVEGDDCWGRGEIESEFAKGDVEEEEEEVEDVEEEEVEEEEEVDEAEVLERKKGNKLLDFCGAVLLWGVSFTFTLHVKECQHWGPAATVKLFNLTL